MKQFLLLVLSICWASATEDLSANQLFTADIYKQLAAKEEGNFLVSPFSAATALAFAEAGAKDESGQELRQALHLPNDPDLVEKIVKETLRKVKSGDGFTLKNANKLYFKSGFELKPEFKRKASEVYGAEAEPVDFKQNVETVQKINTWVEEQTNNKIKNVLSSNDVDELTRAVLINSLFLKANWSKPFPLIQTDRRAFHKTASESVQVDTLNHYRKYFNYYECPHLEAEFLELPLKGEEASLVVVLPKQKDGLGALEGNLQDIFAPQHNLSKEFLNVALPKFRIETSIDVKEALKNLGVKKIFDDKEADLSGIAGEKGDLYVNKASQKTFIDVSEEGVEAGAATLVVIGVPTSAQPKQPKSFVADHPFIFYIKVKDIILFAGRVTDPKY